MQPVGMVTAIPRDPHAPRHDGTLTFHYHLVIS